MASEAIYCKETNKITPVFVNKDIGKLGEVTVALVLSSGHFIQRLPIRSTKVNCSVKISTRQTPHADLPDIDYRKVKDIYNHAESVAIRRSIGSIKRFLDKCYTFKCPSYFFVPNEQMKVNKEHLTN